MEWAIRAARVEDAEGITLAHERASSELFLETIGEPLAEVLPYETRLSEFRETIARMSREAQILVAESHGTIIGLAVCVREREGEGEVRDLHVLPEAWGTGVAAELIAAAVEALRGMGASHAFLWVGEENPRARRFYEREGWRHDGTSQPSPLGPIELRYTRTLRAGPPE